MGAQWQPWSLLFLFLLLLPWDSGALQGTDGGWPTSTHAALTEGDHCTVERRDANLTYSQFIQQYAFSRPVILQGITDNSEFQAGCTKEKLLARFGDRLVRLSTANTYSYRKVDLPFQDYIDQFLEPQDLASLGSETLYFFGDNNFTEWASLFQKYRPPPFRIPGTSGAYSFGIAGSGTGVPFHWHGPGYSEVIFGRKRWFLYPPEKTPDFHPNRTTLSWLLDTYPLLPPWERPLECTIRPGEVRHHCPNLLKSPLGMFYFRFWERRGDLSFWELKSKNIWNAKVLYFPDRWWHATLNLDTSVFISTFLG